MTWLEYLDERSRKILEEVMEEVPVPKPEHIYPDGSRGDGDIEIHWVSERYKLHLTVHSKDAFVGYSTAYMSGGCELNEGVIIKALKKLFKWCNDGAYGYEYPDYFWF